MRQAEEALEKQSRPAPLIDIGFRNGGPGEPGPNELRPPADYLAWSHGGPLPTTQAGLDWFITGIKVMEEV
jgi:hypothetical protein